MTGAAFLMMAGALLVTGIILNLWAMAASPLGFEDETGFHVGAEGVAEDEEDGLVWGNPS